MAVNVLSLVRDPDLCFKQGRLSLAVLEEEIHTTGSETVMRSCVFIRRK